ncbi:MAG TPA: CDP-glycerol glycerophosphotransferase family protein [Solirubrobacteraceae bacterium]|nr:CDP-glycerol glycerophosphotransferase family protein [Solirubrobacteraceae bacterium]
MEAHINELRLDGDRLLVRGWAFADDLGNAEQRARARSGIRAEVPRLRRRNELRLVLLRPGRLRRLRYLIAAVAMETRCEHRFDASTGLAWWGFSATLNPRRLRRAGGWRAGTWHLYVTLSGRGTRCVRKVFSFDLVAPPAAVELPAPPSLLIRAAPTERNEVAVEVATRWAAIRSCRLDDGALMLSGEAFGCSGGRLELELEGAEGTRKRSFPLDVAGRRPRAFRAHLPLPEVVRTLQLPSTGHDGEGRTASSGALYVLDGTQRVRVALAEGCARAPASWCEGTREVALLRSGHGDASLIVRVPGAVLTAVRWGHGGTLAVEGRELRGVGAELVLFSVDRLTQHAFPLQRTGDGRFASVLTPAAITSLAGSLPLPEGRWHLHVRSVGESDTSGLIPVSFGAEIAALLPLTSVVAHKPFTLAATTDGEAVLAVGRDLGDDERGPFHARVLRSTAYAGRRTEPLLDTVVYTSFRGRQYSDSPRAIHEELVRRSAPLEHLWIVRDGACRVPETARILREGSREHHQALAQTRYLVTNDHFPEWFERRTGQTCVQTWHGTPLKKLGFDVSKLRGATRQFERAWDRQVRNWQYVVSPNRFSTPILQRAYALDAEMLETGYPRDDVLAGPHRDVVGRRVRERIGVPDSVRVVLYAPTFRDHLKDSRGRYRLDLQLDLDRLREAIGPDTVVLLRKHHYIVDAVPTTPDGLVRDVSSYPDGTELLLAADILITDYSSMSVDFANTGRPMLFFTYDIDAYRETIRGFYVDFEATVPGPLLGTSDEVAEALRDIDSVRSHYAHRYDAFVSRFCELDDGAATARAVDRLFAE